MRLPDSLRLDSLVLSLVVIIVACASLALVGSLAWDLLHTLTAGLAGALP